MTIAGRVARRFMASNAEYFEEQLDGFSDLLAAAAKHAGVLARAKALLRPVTECLHSKPLAKVLVNLDGEIDRVSGFEAELQTLHGELVRLDQKFTAEQRRLETLLQDSEDEDFEVTEDDVQVPRELGPFLARLERYEKAVDRASGEDLGLSLDDLGDAGSPALRAYQRLIETLPGYDELTPPELYVDRGDAASRILENIE